MATPNFNAIVGKVRDWSNRDLAALPVSVIQDGLRYAADKAYHMLETPPLEATITYSALTLADIDAIETRNGFDIIALPIPSDLSRFIFLRTTGDTGIVFNEKTDVRTGWDMNADKYSPAGFWYRQGPNIYVSGRLMVDDVFELHYYKRLPALNAVYAVNQSNINAEVVNFSLDGMTDGALDPDRVAITSTNTFTTPVTGVTVTTIGRSATAGITIVGTVTNLEVGDLVTVAGVTGVTAYNRTYTVTGLGSILATSVDTTGDAFDGTPVFTDATITARTPKSVGFWIPEESPNWLRDENEKILLFGALMECGSYLQDADLYQSFSQRYEQEINDLNNEDKKRTASGGNVQMHYNGRGLL